MTEVFVLPDIHGNWRLALHLLEQEGLVEWPGHGPVQRLREDVTVIQLGDLGNCVWASRDDDLMSFRLVGPVISKMLIGNHEHPYFGGPAFDGFGYLVEIKEALWRLNDQHLIQAAFEVRGILLTHAGVTCDIDQVDAWHEGGDNKALEVADGLNMLWDNREYRHAMFSAIGYHRGGINPLGGILWADWQEEKSYLFPQIFGHTVGQTYRTVGPLNGSPSFEVRRPYNSASPMNVRALCIDVGAGKKARKILGCWINDEGVRIVAYEHRG